MINPSDLTSLAKLYSPGTVNNSNYVFAGGTAVQCWLHHYHGVDRKHGDIDLFAFNGEFLKLVMGKDFKQTAFYRGQYTPHGILSFSQNTTNCPCDIVRGSYFDSEIAPTQEDVRCIQLEDITVLVLSPEFITVSKLSYPNVHRSRDFQDVLALNKAGCLQNPDYLSELLSKTALGKLITARDILYLQTENNLQALEEHIHRQLIRRFFILEECQC